MCHEHTSRVPSLCERRDKRVSHRIVSNRTVERDAALLIVGLADLLQNLARLLLELLAHVLALVVDEQIEGAVRETETADNDTDDAEAERERGGLISIHQGLRFMPVSMWV